jgi:hypothetical protein
MALVLEFVSALAPVLAVFIAWLGYWMQGRLNKRLQQESDQRKLRTEQEKRKLSCFTKLIGCLMAKSLLWSKHQHIYNAKKKIEHKEQTYGALDGDERAEARMYRTIVTQSTGPLQDEIYEVLRNNLDLMITKTIERRLPNFIAAFLAHVNDQQVLLLKEWEETAHLLGSGEARSKATKEENGLRVQLSTRLRYPTEAEVFDREAFSALNDREWAAAKAQIEDQARNKLTRKGSTKVGENEIALTFDNFIRAMYVQALKGCSLHSAIGAAQHGDDDSTVLALAGQKRYSFMKKRSTVVESENAARRKSSNLTGNERAQAVFHKLVL